MQRPTVSNELKELARLLADWAAPALGVTVYLFGSRVRGDHKPDSDVDVHFQFGDRLSEGDMRWWDINQKEDFEMIKAKLPGPLKILERWDAWCQCVVAAKVVYQNRNVRCVWLPPKLQNEGGDGSMVDRHIQRLLRPKHLYTASES